MTPLELCEPIFTKICVLNRLGRQQGDLLTYDHLRAEIEQLLAGVRNTAEADPALRMHWQKLELPMIFFIDSMIAESGLALAPTWNRTGWRMTAKNWPATRSFSICSTKD